MKNSVKGLICFSIILIAVCIIGCFAIIKETPSTEEVKAESNIPDIVDNINAEINFSDENVPALIDDGMGSVEETETIDGEKIPTVEEVDGGLFEDITSGTSVVEGNYQDLGWSEEYDVSSPTAFKNATIGKCIVANNIYGAQCVSLARVFWWSYANRDVSTCGTGMAKGMMDCSTENAGNDFEVYWKNDADKIQAGDWLIFTGGRYGHVGMALGGLKNGYVALLGENQGGRACNGGGAATNVINLNISNLIGYYRPKAYIKKPAEKPASEPTQSSEKPTTKPIITDTIPLSGCTQWHVENGDTMSKIMLDCEGTIVYGEAMNQYADSWYSLFVKPGQSVYEGWCSPSGVGLYAGDDIEHRIK